MEVYCVMETRNGMMGGESIGVFTTRKKAIRKIILLNGNYYNELDGQELERFAKSFGIRGTISWIKFKKEIKKEFKEADYGYGLCATYGIIKHELDSFEIEADFSVSHSISDDDD